MIPFALKCELIAKQERLELIRLAFATAEKSVKFISRGTKCSVCALVGVDSTLKITSTTEEIRYCHCDECGCNLKAVGESVKKPFEVVQKPHVNDNKNKKSKNKSKQRVKK